MNKLSNDRYMRRISAERYIEQLRAEVYPIALIKFLLNKRRIMNYFSKAASRDFNPKFKFDLDIENCEACKQKKDQGMLCRQHTSIQRVMNADAVAYDLDTYTYIYQNEIYRMVGKKLVIVYCPHPKLISGEITDSKVRKINPITVEDPNLEGLPQYNRTCEFISSQLLDQHVACWFNNEFSIVTIPADRNGQNWCLFPNR